MATQRFFDYHNRIKQRIASGELIGYYYTETYPNIGDALVLLFRTEPHKRPIRPHRYQDYEIYLSEGVIECPET